MSEFPGPDKAQFLAQQLNVALGLPAGSAIFAQPTKSALHNMPKKIRPRHRMVVMLAEAGWTNKQIAESTGYTESRVSIILNAKHPELLRVRAEFASKVADTIDDTANRLKLYANEMLDTMVYHARQKEAQPQNSRMAARDILHMAGYSPVRRQVNVEIPVPAAELLTAAAKIQAANEVALRKSEWEIRPTDEVVGEEVVRSSEEDADAA